MPINDESEPSAPFHDNGGDRAALIIIDMINCFDFPGADVLRPKALQAAGAILDLRRNFEEREWPVIYVNDNFGEWHSEKSRLVARAIDGQNPVVAILQPRDTDFFVIKPQFSGFYATNLPVLLPKLGVTKLVLTGIATDICVLFTAADAHMRDYALWIPENAVAAEDDDQGRWALAIMEKSMGAETASTQMLPLSEWLYPRDL